MHELQVLGQLRRKLPHQLLHEATSLWSICGIAAAAFAFLPALNSLAAASASVEDRLVAHLLRRTYLVRLLVTLEASFRMKPEERQLLPAAAAFRQGENPLLNTLPTLWK
jgi:hypothetical protein